MLRKSLNQLQTLVHPANVRQRTASQTGCTLARFFGVFGLFAITAIAIISAAATRADEPDKPFRFVVYGDTRDGHSIHKKLVAAIMKEKPDFVIQTGDLVNRSSPALWKIYDDITGDMRKQIPVYPSRGNHDGGKEYEDRFTAPFTSGNKLYYSFDKGNSHFVGLAVDEMMPYGPKSPQYQWLDKDLAAAREKARHIIVFFHVPPYSIGSHGMNRDVQDVLCPLFIKYGVRAVFNGHDHIYYHTKRDGIPYIVTGGGGAPLYYPDPEKGAIEGDKWERVNHYLVCDVNGDTINVRAIRVDGTTIEQFVISR